MLTSMKEILEMAEKGGYAIAAFNTSNIEITQAIVEAACELDTPVIVATSEKAIEYAGIDVISAVVRKIAERAPIPIALHLDHGRSIESIVKAIRFGWTSVMIDASDRPFEENVEITRKVVEIAHSVGVTVEAELGKLRGIEDGVSVEEREAFMTDPGEAKRFVEETGIDALAVAIGTSHGAYKFKGEPKLDFRRLEEIREKVKIPLVLHGASGVPEIIVQEINRLGGDIGGAKGVPDEELREAVKKGIRKVNTDTDLRLAFTLAVRRFLKERPSEFDPRKILRSAKELMKKVALHRISVLRPDLTEIKLEL